MAICMMAVMVPALADGVNGTFEGEADGFGGTVKVTLTLENSVITAVSAEGANETEGIGSLAIANLPATWAEKNSICDTLSGATITSEGMQKAAAAALAAAGLNAEDYMAEVADAPVADATYDADIVVVESQAMVGGNSVRATGGMNASKTGMQDQNTFGESAGVEKTLANWIICLPNQVSIELFTPEKLWRWGSEVEEKAFIFWAIPLDSFQTSWYTYSTSGDYLFAFQREVLKR